MTSQHHKESAPRSGKVDGLLALMKRTGVPLTRQHYLNLLHMGRPPSQLTPEQEEELPHQFRQEPYVRIPPR